MTADQVAEALLREALEKLATMTRDLHGSSITTLAAHRVMVHMIERTMSAGGAAFELAAAEILAATMIEDANKSPGAPGASS